MTHINTFVNDPLSSWMKQTSEAFDNYYIKKHRKRYEKGFAYSKRSDNSSFVYDNG